MNSLHGQPSANVAIVVGQVFPVASGIFLTRHSGILGIVSLVLPH